jgi:hypothetical protein
MAAGVLDTHRGLVIIVIRVRRGPELVAAFVQHWVETSASRVPGRADAVASVHESGRGTFETCSRP